MKLIHLSKTDIGLVRAANEDSIGSIINSTGVYSNVYIVCDGMGGHVGGARASQTAIRSIKEYFNGTPNPTPNIALKDAIEFANMQIFGDAESNPEFKGMGTTVTLMVESAGFIYIAHVGDSRIYINTDKRLYRLTKDHSFVQSLVDARMLTDEEMETHPRKNELSRALGIAMEVDVEVASQPIIAKQGDKFLLCTDGLCGLINDTMILKAINHTATLELTVDKLIELAKKAGGHDNISADLIEVIESDFTKTQFVDKNNVPNSNTGTQQLNIPAKQPKPKISKQLLQMILLVVVLVVIVVGGSTMFIEKPPVSTEDTTTVSTSDKLFLEKLSKLPLDENYSEELEIVYDALKGSRKDSLWKFGEFTAKINDLKFTLEDSNRDKQQFFIAEDDTIISRAEAKKRYEKGDSKFKKGDLIFILTKDLKVKDNSEDKNNLPVDLDPKNELQSDASIVNEVLDKVKNEKRAIKNKMGCTVTFEPTTQRQTTEEAQSYKVTVTVKLNSTEEKFEFDEKEEVIPANNKTKNKGEIKTGGTDVQEVEEIDSTATDSISVEEDVPKGTNDTLIPQN
ncbi:MAG: Stp1/IreP family PP2C-type Ser/Thr phosphatase [Proteobacteria bacterium]|nr:Stp1/IreP family PP2C-type Ser/Thr phosphatase [Pseudomonadota bacterium]